MATYKVYKETALPGTLAANSIYLITSQANANYLEIYVTNNAGTAHRHVPTITEIQTLIDSSMSAAGNLLVVNTIAERNALAPTKNVQVVVLDATGDATVSSGAATYLYRLADATWYKLSEAESLDVTLAWSSIVGKPSSSASAIDAAVSATHTHTNLTQLNKVGEDGGGELTYNGSSVRARLETTGW